MTLPPAYFDGMYDGTSDPWGFAERWYERRKRAVTMAALPAQRYLRAFEPGCSTGLLTEALAARCDEVIAWDVAAVAVEQAAGRVHHHPRVVVERRAVPAEWPPGSFDLVVLSEVGYYFDRATLDRVLAAATGALPPGGTLLTVHWRHAVADYPLGGDDVVAALAQTAESGGLLRQVRHEEADFLLEVHRRPPAASVAVGTGLL